MGHHACVPSSRLHPCANATTPLCVEADQHTRVTDRVVETQADRAGKAEELAQLYEASALRRENDSRLEQVSASRRRVGARESCEQHLRDGVVAVNMCSSVSSASACHLQAAHCVSRHTGGPAAPHKYAVLCSPSDVSACDREGRGGTVEAKPGAAAGAGRADGDDDAVLVCLPDTSQGAARAQLLTASSTCHASDAGAVCT